MKFYSTNNRSLTVTFKEAVKSGLASDAGLFMPIEIPQLPEDFFLDIHKLSFNEIAFEAAKHFVEDEIPHDELKNIIDSSFTFDAPLVPLKENINILELFHGPTLAFKDFGARFMANVVSYFGKDEKKEIIILVATSGDTGSAVSNAFYEIPNVKVILLYPSEKVSYIQEKQLTTLGKNISALEVLGSFDDCQKMVKQAFVDEDLKKLFNLSSANSINIARLLPQSFYYFYAFAQLFDKKSPIIFSVPCGNFGDLTGGLIAKKMGLPIFKFIAAINSNDVFLKYIQTGKFEPKPSISTISNAMDVGNPNNFARVLDLYGDDHRKIKNDIYAASFTDEETKSAIRDIFEKYNYIIDPHGAVGYLGLKTFLNKNNLSKFQGVILETAHPAKFIDIVEEAIDKQIEMPGRLKSSLEKEKSSVKISNSFEKLKNYLLTHYTQSLE